MGSSSVGAGKSKAEGKMSKFATTMMKEFWAETRETRQTYQDQMQELLTTGGVGARVPIIARAEEAQRTATSQAIGSVDERLAQKGLAGTPFGEAIRAQTVQQGASTVAGVGPGMAAQWLQTIPGYLQAQSSSVMGATAGTRQTGAEAKSWM